MARILVADDEAHIRRVLEARLQMDGHEVILTADGREAWERFQEEQPDLVILDVNMPEMTGLEVASLIRGHQDERLSRVPILVLTARGQESDEEAGYKAGADLFLTKPFSPRELSQLVQELLNRRSQRT